MKELIANLVQQANLSESQATAAADTVKQFLESKLPDAIKGPVLSVLTGEQIDSAVDKARDLIGGFLK